jgi:hypothetical protein
MRRYRRTDMTQLIVVFRSLGNAPNKNSLHCIPCVVMAMCISTGTASSSETFEVRAALLLMKIQIFWDVTLLRPVSRYRRFERPHLPHLQGRAVKTGWTTVQRARILNFVFQGHLNGPRRICEAKKWRIMRKTGKIVDTELRNFYSGAYIVRLG